MCLYKVRAKPTLDIHVEQSTLREFVRFRHLTVVTVAGKRASQLFTNMSVCVCERERDIILCELVPHKVQIIEDYG